MAAIGIDFGYSAIRAAFLTENGNEIEIKVIEDESGFKSIPSVITLDGKKRLIGKEAVNHSFVRPENSIYGIKRLIGRQNGDEVLENVLLYSTFDFKLTENEKSVNFVLSDGKTLIKEYTSEEVLATLFDNVREVIEKNYGVEARKAVISVPIHFTSSQRQAVINAAMISDMEVLRLVNDTTAAAVYDAWTTNMNVAKKILVIDFGASSLDISVIEINKNEINVLSTCGSANLGGVDFDNRLLNLCIEKLKEQFEVDVSQMKKILNKLRSQCEKAKIILQSKEHAVVAIDSPVEGKNLKVSISRSEFEEVCEDLFEKINKCIDKVFRDGTVNKCDLNDVVVTGCASKMRKFQAILNSCELKTSSGDSGLEDTCVKGVAILSSQLTSITDTATNFIIKEINPFNVGISKVIPIGQSHAPSSSAPIITIPALINRCAAVPTFRTAHIKLPKQESEDGSFADMNIFISEDKLVYSLQPLITARFSQLSCNTEKSSIIEIKFHIDINSMYTIEGYELVDDEYSIQMQNKVDVILLNENTREEIMKIKDSFMTYKKEAIEEEKRWEMRHEYETNLFKLKQMINASVDIERNDEIDKIRTELQTMLDDLENSEDNPINYFEANNVKVNELILSLSEILVKVERDRLIEKVRKSVIALEERIENVKQCIVSNSTTKIIESLEIIKKWLSNYRSIDFNEDCIEKLNDVSCIDQQLDALLEKDKDLRRKFKTKLCAYIEKLKLSSPFAFYKMSKLRDSCDLELYSKIDELEYNLSSADLPTLFDMHMLKLELNTFIDDKKKSLYEIEKGVDVKAKFFNLFKSIQVFFAKNNAEVGYEIRDKIGREIASVNYFVEYSPMAPFDDLEQKFNALNLLYKNLESNITEAAKEKLLNDIINFWEMDEIGKIKANGSRKSLFEIDNCLNMKRRFLERKLDATKGEIDKLSAEVIKLKKSAKENANSIKLGNITIKSINGNSEYTKLMEAKKSMSDKKDGVYVGIDFGTSQSSISIYKKGKLHSIPLDKSMRRIPSFVAFTEFGIAVGNKAKEYFQCNPRNTFFNIKRLLGKKSIELEKENHLSYTIIDSGEAPRVVVDTVDDKKYVSPEELSALILLKVKKYCEKYTKRSVSAVSITVPSMFNCSQRKAIFDAAKIAGFETVNLVNDTKALALHHYWCSLKEASLYEKEMQRHILIVSIGAAFVSVSIVHFSEMSIQVIFHNGTDSGGNAFDNGILNHILNQIGKEEYSKKDYIKYLSVCEDVKICLSSSNTANIPLDELKFLELSRTEFENINASYLNSIFQCIHSAMSFANRRGVKIFKAAVAGNSAEIPAIKRYLNNELKLTGVDYYNETCLSFGASLYSAFSEDIILRHKTISDVSAFTYSIHCRNKADTVLCRNSAVPVAVERSIKDASEEASFIELKEHAFPERIVCSYELRAVDKAGLGKSPVGLHFRVNESGIVYFGAKDSRGKIYIIINQTTLHLHKLKSQFGVLKNDIIENDCDKMSLKRRLIREVTDKCKENCCLGEDHQSVLSNILTDVLKWCECERSDEEFESKLNEVQYLLCIDKSFVAKCYLPD